MMKRLLLVTVFLTGLPPVFALDSACEPLLKASEAKLAQESWHSITESKDLKVQAIKLKGEYFVEFDGKWQKSPMDMNQAEIAALELIKSGTLKITECKDEGSETLDGIDMQVFSYSSEIPGSGVPKTTSKLYIGKADGLPYKTLLDQEGSVNTIKYQDISPPKI